MSNEALITELKAENTRLRADLEKAKEREKDYEDTRRASLFMLEDLERSRDEIERAKLEWEATFDGITDPLFIHDREFKLIRANLAYKNAAGMKFKEFVGMPYYEVFPKMEGPFKMCLKAREMQEEFSCPVTNRIFKVRFYPIKDVNGEYLYSIHLLEDITEAKRSAERLKEEVDVTTHLLMISEATAHTTDIDKLMEQVVHCAQKIMGYGICLSYQWDKDDKVFRPSREIGLAGGSVSLFRAEPVSRDMELVRKAMEGRRPTLTLHPLPEGEGKTKTPSPLAGEGRGEGGFLKGIDIGAMAVIPLIGRKETLGLIIGIYINPPESPFAKGGLSNIPLLEKGGKGGFEFTERDTKVMEGIMHQVSIAIEEARLYRESIDRAMELSSRIETIKAMHEIDRAILSTLNRDEILETAVMMISRVIPCDKAAVTLVDKERGGFVTVAGFGIDFLPKGSFVPFTDTTAVEMIKTGRTQYVGNIEEIEEPLQQERRLLDNGFLSIIRVPLMVKGEVIGGLSIGSKRRSIFTPENLSTIEKMAAQISVALENARLISDLEELFIGTVKSLSSAIDAKSPWTAGHSERVTRYALRIGKEMGLSEKELKDLELAGLLHDVGKIGTYDVILDKPDKLSNEEQDLIKQHPVKGAEILAPIRQLKEIIPAIRHHQEFYDGTGYPEGLTGEAIPLFARIIGVADTVDAMGADRPYRKGKPMDAITAELNRCSGAQFDPKVVEAFLNTLGQEAGAKANK